MMVFDWFWDLMGLVVTWAEIAIEFASVGVYTVTELWGDPEDIDALDAFMDWFHESIDLVDLPDNTRSIYE